jgi:hypothetical protein
MIFNQGDRARDQSPLIPHPGGSAELLATQCQSTEASFHSFSFNLLATFTPRKIMPIKQGIMNCQRSGCKNC